MPGGLCYYSKMLKSIDRYILKEISSPFAIGLSVYTFTLLIHNVFKLSDELISKKASTITIIKILIYIMPFLLTVTIPIATLMGVLAALSRMSTDSEIIAFRTMGINNMRILKPVMLFSLFSFLCTALLTMYITPEANFRLDRTTQQFRLSLVYSEIKPRVFKRLYPYVIYFNEMDNRTKEWKEVFLYSRRDGSRDTIISAQRGMLVGGKAGEDTSIILKNAQVHSFERKKPDTDYAVVHYNYLKEEVPNLMRLRQTRRRGQLNLVNLIQHMKQKPDNKLLQIEFNRRFSIPFACLALGFLALSMGIFTKKGGNITGFIISLGITFIYYTIEMFLENMAKKGIVSPFLGIWSPNILLIVTGIFLYYYSSREKSINWERFVSFFTGIGRRLVPAREKFVSQPKEKIRLKGIKKIDLYVVKKLMLTFVFIFFTLIFVFYIIDLLELIDDLVDNNIPFHYALKYLFFHTPEIINFALPVSILTAVLLSFSIMSKNNEIVAVQVSGISLQRLAMPALILGLLFSVAFFAIQEAILPGATKKAEENKFIIRKIEQPKDIEINKNWIMAKNNQIYANTFDYKRKRYLNFNSISLDRHFEFKKRIFAKTAVWENDHQLKLGDGFIREFDRGEQISHTSFKKKVITIGEGKAIFSKKIIFSRHLNIQGLKKYIKYLKENNSDSGMYEAKLFHKYANPLSCLVMVLIAIPFSFMMGKKGTIYGIGIAVAISMVFWFTMAIFNSLGTNGILSPFMSAFAPIFIFAAISFFLFINIKT